MLGLKEENRRLLGPVRQCLKLNTTHGKVTYSPDNQSLLVTLPQVWIEYQNLAWSTPARWSDGVTAALLSYNLMTNLWSTFHWYWHLKLHAKDLAGKWHSHS